MGMGRPKAAPRRNNQPAGNRNIYALAVLLKAAKFLLGEATRCIPRSHRELARVPCSGEDAIFRAVAILQQNYFDPPRSTGPARRLPPARRRCRGRQEVNPGLAQSPEGRAMTTDILRQMAVQDQLVGRRAMKLKDPSDFYQLQDDFYRDNPIKVTVGGKVINTADRLPGYATKQTDGPPGAPGVSPGAPPIAPLAAPAPQSSLPRAGGGPEMARMPGTDNPIAQAMAAGDNPHSVMTMGQSALSAGPAAAIGAAYTAPTWAPLVAKLGRAGAKKYLDYTFLAHMLSKGGVP
jgi:hypothetical protein